MSKHFKYLAPIVGGVVFVAYILSAVVHTSDAEAEYAYTELVMTQKLLGDGIGFAAATPRQYKAFGILMRHPRARDYFRGLLRDGHAAGKAYALAGLYRKDERYFWQKVDRSLDDTTRFLVILHGCVGYRANLSDFMSEGAVPNGYLLYDGSLSRALWP